MIAQAAAVTLQRLADSEGFAMGPRADANGIDGVDGRMKMAPLARRGVLSIRRCTSALSDPGSGYHRWTTPVPTKIL